MSQNTLYNQIVVNLKVLSRIQEKGRINTSNTCFVRLESDSYLQCLWRTIRGDSQKSAIKTIKTIIGNAIEYTNNQISFINDLNRDNMNKYELEKFERYMSELDKIREELNYSINGIEKLKITYNVNQTTIAEIDVIIDDIKSQIKKLEHNLANVNKVEVNKVEVNYI